jgi:ribonuclease Z
MIDVALVGTGGMMPLPNRFLSSMLCRINGKLFLFDCGEGTQVSLKLLGWGFKDIGTVCFTHYHADHVSGLPGLLLTINNTGRTEPVHFYGPTGLEYVVRSLSVIAPDLSFPLIFTELDPRAGEYNAEEDDIVLSALPARHRAPCFAYKIELTRRGKFDLERAQKNNIPMAVWSALQKQKDARVVYNDITYTGDMVLGPPRKGLTVAFCTDTRPFNKLVSFVHGADLLICEGLHGDDAEKCAKHMHMSFGEAAEIAWKAEAQRLWLTHFSPALVDPVSQLKYAADIFPRARVGRDRMTKTLRFKE